MNKIYLRLRFLAGALLFLTTLIAYAYTLAPDVLAHDSGEWQAVAATLGISHPPGSPAYIIVSWIFTLMPLGSAAARVSFVSAVMGAAGVAATYWLGLKLFHRVLPAAVAAVTLAAAGLWWSHSVVATPYNAVPAFMAVLMALLLKWREIGDVRIVWAGTFITGVGLSWHPSLLFFVPVLITGVFVMGPWRRLVNLKSSGVAAMLLILGLSFYLYIPVRSAAEPQVAYTRVDSLSALIKYVSASDARSTGHGVLKFPAASELTGRLAEVVRQSYFPSYAIMVFGPAIILLYGGVRRRLGPVGKPLAFLAAGMVAHMAIVFAISGVFAQYYMPLLLYFSLWAGFSVFLFIILGEAYLTGEKLRRLPYVATAVFYFGVLALGVAYKWDFVNHRHDDSMRNYAEMVYSRAEPKAAVLADWESYTGLLYAQKVDHQRQDISLTAVLRENWRDSLALIEAEKGGSQVMFSATLPLEPQPGLQPVSGIYLVDIKGRTYQDLSHGEPFPAAVQLFEFRP